MKRYWVVVCGRKVQSASDGFCTSSTTDFSRPIMRGCGPKASQIDISLR